MKNTFINAINGMKTTENGATAYSTTNSKVYDMFALGAAYRQRSVEDCITLFENAFNEDALLAMKCLFYIRDIRGGQGERRFTRECLKWLANNHEDMVHFNIELIPEFGRWDDLYALYGTKCWDSALALIKSQLILDLDSKTPSLLAKWLKSENASSTETKRLAEATRVGLGLTPKTYRHALSLLRQRINIVERLMSENRWDEIEFDKLPSKAGIKYKNAFARRDIIREKYRDFAMDTTTKVNASALYPYEVVNKALSARGDVDVAMVQKYWDNLPDYTGGDDANVMVMADVSGSMYSGVGSVRPVDMSIAMALYFAEKQKGEFKGNFMTFSRNPQFVTVRGKNFCEKVRNVYNADWGYNTDLVAAFRLILRTAKKNRVPNEDMPKTLMIVSDMEIDSANPYHNETEMEMVKREFEDAGYEMPHLIFWNVNARNDTILDRADGTTCVSGCSPVIFEQVLSGKSGYDLMLEKLNSERYAKVVVVEE